MKQTTFYTPSNRRFRVGDKVVLSNSSSLLISHMPIKGHYGIIVSFEEKEKTTDIIRVQFPDYEYIVSGYSGEFDQVE